MLQTLDLESLERHEMGVWSVSGSIDPRGDSDEQPMGIKVRIGLTRVASLDRVPTRAVPVSTRSC
jgi:hypothetical protein